MKHTLCLVLLSSLLASTASGSDFIPGRRPVIEDVGPPVDLGASPIRVGNPALNPLINPTRNPVIKFPSEEWNFGSSELTRRLPTTCTDIIKQSKDPQARWSLNFLNSPAMQRFTGQKPVEPKAPVFKTETCASSEAQAESLRCQGLFNRSITHSSQAIYRSKLLKGDGTVDAAVLKHAFEVLELGSVFQAANQNNKNRPIGAEEMLEPKQGNTSAFRSSLYEGPKKEGVAGERGEFGTGEASIVLDLTMELLSKIDIAQAIGEDDKKYRDVLQAINPSAAESLSCLLSSSQFKGGKGVGPLTGVAYARAKDTTKAEGAKAGGVVVINAKSPLEVKLSGDVKVEVKLDLNTLARDLLNMGTEREKRQIENRDRLADVRVKEALAEKLIAETKAATLRIEQATAAKEASRPGTKHKDETQEKKKPESKKDDVQDSKQIFQQDETMLAYYESQKMVAEIARLSTIHTDPEQQNRDCEVAVNSIKDAAFNLVRSSPEFDQEFGSAIEDPNQLDVMMNGVIRYDRWERVAQSSGTGAPRPSNCMVRDPVNPDLRENLDLLDALQDSLKPVRYEIPKTPVRIGN